MPTRSALGTLGMPRLLLVLILACSSATPSDAGPEDAPQDGRQDTVRDRSLYTRQGFVGAPSPDGLGYCCPYGYPGCDCFNDGGGFAENEEACIQVSRCDAEPDRFRDSFDEHGCPYSEEVMLDYEPQPCFER
ncbi:MAG: hypothetical protein AB8H86_14055 [Polyangiales bacterium]